MDSIKKIPLPTTNILYVDADNSFKLSVPKEINLPAIKKRFSDRNHLYAQNDKFLFKCSELLKTIYTFGHLEYKKTGQNYVRLASKFLKSKFGSSKRNSPIYYKDMVNALIELKFIEVDQSYFANDGKGYSKGYRLNISQPELLEQSSIDRAIINVTNRVNDLEYLSEVRRLKLDELNYILIANLLDKPAKDLAMSIYYNWVNNNDLVRFDKYGRKHSLLTLLPSELRCCFTINDEPVFEVDAHACQPYLFLITVKNYINQGNETAKSLKHLMEEFQELKNYIARIQNKVFYEHLYRLHYHRPQAPIDKMCMSRFKEMLFTYIFFSDYDFKKELKKVQRVFKEAYPMIYSILVDLKEKEYYKEIARNLQRFESEIMDEAINRLKSINESGFYLRFHDAILCTKQDCEVVAEIMEGTMLEEVDVLGTVKADKWGDSLTEVLDSLKLHILMNRKSHSFQKMVGYEKRTMILKSIRNVKQNIDGECHRQQNLLTYYDSDPFIRHFFVSV